MKAPAKLVCLETYWNEKLFQSFSVKPFFEAMAPLLRPPLMVAHRFVESEAGLAYYTRRPDGVMWRRTELFDAPIYYLAFHGKPGSVISLTGDIGAREPDRGVRRLWPRLPNLVYFAAAACCAASRAALRAASS